MTIREGGPADYPTLARLMRLTTSMPMTVEALHQRDLTLKFQRHLLFAEVDGETVGYSMAARWPRPEPVRYLLVTGVEPAYRGRGIGRELFFRAHDWAIEQGAEQLWAQFLEPNERSERLLRLNGFEPSFELREASVDPTRFDPAPFSEVLDQIEAAGIEFARYSDFGNSEENRRRLHELYSVLENDVPYVGDADYPGYEVWLESVYGAHYFNPGLHFLAVHEGQWIGMAAVGEYVPGVFMNLLTGVRRSHRGMRLGLALKLVSLRELAQRGVTELRTQNHDTNEAILGLNEKLGYRPLPVLHTYEKRLLVDKSPTNVE